MAASKAELAREVERLRSLLSRLVDGGEPGEDDGRMMKDLFARYRSEHVRSGTLRPRTVRMYERQLEVLQAAIGDVRVDELSRTHVIENVMRPYEGRPMARKLVEKLRHVLAMAQEWGWTNVDPTRGIRLPKPKARQRVLTDFEIDVLFRALNRCAHPHTRRACMLLASTGFRIDEVVNIHGVDVDDEHRRVWLRGAKYGPRWSPIGGDALAMLAAWRTDPGLVFRTKAGRGLDPKTVRRALGRASELAKIEHVFPHHFRHTFATRALLSGKPVHVVSALLGHSCPTVTLRTYAHVMGPDVAQAADDVSCALTRVLPPSMHRPMHKAVAASTGDASTGELGRELERLSSLLARLLDGDEGEDHATSR